MQINKKIRKLNTTYLQIILNKFFEQTRFRKITKKANHIIVRVLCLCEKCMAYFTPLKVTISRLFKLLYSKKYPFIDIIAAVDKNATKKTKKN